MLKHASREYLQTLLGLYNDMLSTGQINVAWRETIFSMLPKSGDLTQAKNWRPIAILRISYKLFSRLLYHRLQPILDPHVVSPFFIPNLSKRTKSDQTISLCIWKRFSKPAWHTNMSFQLPFWRKFAHLRAQQYNHLIWANYVAA